jgi:hypothetical protein
MWFRYGIAIPKSTPITSVLGAMALDAPGEVGGGGALIEV